MKFLSVAIPLLAMLSCEGTSIAGSSNTIVATGIPTETTTTIESRKSLRTYIFGHSLILHTLSDTPETTVPHWLYELASEAGKKYRFNGQFGYLGSYAEHLPPSPQLGFSHTDIWDADSSKTFASVNFDSVLITALNFIQYRGPSEPYEGDNPTNTDPISASLTLVDWLNTQEPGIQIYIYENWPELAAYMSNQDEFLPLPEEVATFHADTINLNSGKFHRWWLDYQDELIRQRPDLEIKLIPVGPILSQLLTDTPLSGIDVHALYEDSSPHGRPTIYFLAALVTYMAMYGEKPPADYDIPETVDPLVRDHYSPVVNQIWSQLNAFNFNDGSSRVF